MQSPTMSGSSANGFSESATSTPPTVESFDVPVCQGCKNRLEDGGEEVLANP